MSVPSVSTASDSVPASTRSFNFDKSIAAQKRSSSMLIAQNVTMVGIKPQLSDNGIVEYKVFIEYAPDSRYSKATLDGAISLAGVVDTQEYVVTNGSGVWSASYEERWQGQYTVTTIDDATADEKQMEFGVIYYTNPMSAIHGLMAQDVASFFDMDRDDLGNLPEV